MLRPLRFAIKWLILLSLPLTLFPFLGGLIGGIYFARWNSNQVYATTDKFLHEIRDAMGDWGVGAGAPSFYEFQDTHNDMGILRIKSNDWTSKLGYWMPDQNLDFDDVNAPIDKFADLAHLMFDTTCRPQKPKEQWLYISDFGWPILSEWDAAFKYVIRYAQGDRKLNQTGIYFAECAHNAGFLCGVWNTRAPALVHFIVEDEAPEPEDVEEGLTYSIPLKDLRSVTVRIIEFGLQDVYSGLPSNVFPTREEQLLAIMTGDRLYEQFEPYQPMDQLMKRFNEYMSKVGDKPDEVLWYLWEADRWWSKWVIDPIGLEDAAQFLHTLTFILTGNAVVLFVLAPFDMIKNLVDDFSGKPKRGDYIMAGMEEEEMRWAGSGEPWTFEDWSRDLTEVIRKAAEDQSSKSVANMAATTMTEHTPQTSADSEESEEFWSSYKSKMAHFEQEVKERNSKMASTTRTTKAEEEEPKLYGKVDGGFEDWKRSLLARVERNSAIEEEESSARMAKEVKETGK